MITRKTFIDSDKVRNFCIKNQYYTRGDNSAYIHLLCDLCGRKFISDDELKEIAIDIINHSDCQFELEAYDNNKNYLLSDMMTRLHSECCTLIYVVSE